MRAQILPFRAPPRRVWYLRELTNGLWIGQRVDCGGGLVDQTVTGPEWRVTAIVNDHRQGLPMVRQPLADTTGSSAA